MAWSPSRRMTSPTSCSCPTRTSSYIAAPFMFSAMTTTKENTHSSDVLVQQASFPKAGMHSWASMTLDIGWHGAVWHPATHISGMHRRRCVGRWRAYHASSGAARLTPTTRRLAGRRKWERKNYQHTHTPRVNTRQHAAYPMRRTLQVSHENSTAQHGSRRMPTQWCALAWHSQGSSAPRLVITTQNAGGR